ncbi:hypothetical protein H072_5355 [Dactylellina haptotyla CBS 200.50]|uniref:CFEM domain-containing protein n=1 Tax=Dactylellina haptotyla (strain CBS 200.50) TaxID=1284197 RepID=S8AHZ5_DACHA|nr:hypothetical protein H072_5355 [Dactylellina haptotyla CBS 200.50]
MRIATVQIGLAVGFLSTRIGLCAAQTSLDGLPACAQNCVSQGLTSSSCNPLDVQCFCNDQSLVSSLTPCLVSACSTDDLSTTVQFVTQLCAAVGVTDINAPTPSASTSTPNQSIIEIIGEPTPATSSPTTRSTSSSRSSSVEPPTRLPSGSNTQSQSSNTSTGSEVSNTSPPATRSSQPPSSTSASPVSGTRSKLSTAAIVGIAVGVGVPILVAIGVVAYRYNVNRKLLDVPVVPLHNDPNMTDMGVGMGGIEDQRPGWGSGIQDQSRSGWG